jgi:signal transduction histidine kinase
MKMKKHELEILRKARLAILGCKLEGVIHNLNSPLNTILGYAQILRNRNPELKAVEKIYQAGLEIDKEFKNLALDIEKFKNEMPVFLSLNEEIVNHLKLMSFNLFFKHNIKVETDLTKNLPKLHIAAGDLHLILDNLLNNAVEALQAIDENKIFITTKLSNSRVELEINNRGKIPTPTEKIFLPEFTTKNNSEYGLGLPLVKYILKKYNSEIKLIAKEERVTAQIMFPIRG